MSDQAEDNEAIAAEYVLGTLSDHERRRFEAWLENDPGLRRSVERWGNVVHPLAELLPPMRPNPRVWAAIEAAIARPADRSPESVQRLKRRVAAWRGYALAASFAALGAVGYLGVMMSTPRTGAMYVSLLADEQARPMWLVTVNSRNHEMVAKPLGVSAQFDRSYELWLIPSGGRAPVSLGLLDPGAPMRMKMPDIEASMMPQAGALAVSVEPPGGSPQAGPTGPVMHKGAVVTQDL